MPDCRGCAQEAPALLEENTRAVRLMLACETQWRAGFGGAYGLDYNAAFTVAGLLGLTIDADLFRGLRALEHEQLKIWNEKAPDNEN